MRDRSSCFSHHHLAAMWQMVIGYAIQEQNFFRRKERLQGVGVVKKGGGTTLSTGLRPHIQAIHLWALNFFSLGSDACICKVKLRGKAPMPNSIR